MEEENEMKMNERKKKAKKKKKKKYNKKKHTKNPRKNGQWLLLNSTQYLLSLH